MNKARVGSETSLGAVRRGLTKEGRWVLDEQGVAQVADLACPTARSTFNDFAAAWLAEDGSAVTTVCLQENCVKTGTV